MSAPLIFLPGWCVGRGPLSAAVNAENGQIFDLPGYGEAPLITDFAAAADDIANRLPSGTTLAGWSLGAQLALAVAARHPDKVGKLVLVAGTASFVQRDGWPIHGRRARCWRPAWPGCAISTCDYRPRWSRPQPCSSTAPPIH
jgi:pimeloyl-[acyl-carrier protein] methyl ester esterase